MTQVNQNIQNEGQDNLSMTIDPNNENYSMTVDQNTMTDDDQMKIDPTSMNKDQNYNCHLGDEVIWESSLPKECAHGTEDENNSAINHGEFRSMMDHNDGKKWNISPEMHSGNLNYI